MFNCVKGEIVRFGVLVQKRAIIHGSQVVDPVAVFTLDAGPALTIKAWPNGELVTINTNLIEINGHQITYLLDTADLNAGRYRASFTYRIGLQRFTSEVQIRIQNE